jgi:3-phenylpropionate/trans-cinnamate dioxygenase ferredoxin subunit
MTVHRVCPLAELPVDSCRRFDLAGTAVAVSRFEDGVHAVSDTCLHRSGSISGGTLRCRQHWWRYDARTGELRNSVSTKLQTFPARVVEGWVEVDCETPVQGHSLREILLAHARGENV